MSEQRNGEVIWRASTPGVREAAAVTKVPFLTHCHDAASGTRYRGGQVTSVTATEIGVKFQGEAQLTLTATVARDLKSDVRVGDPIIVELEATGYGVSALHGGAFAGVGPSGPQEASVATEYHPSRIVESIWNL